MTDTPVPGPLPPTPPPLAQQSSAPPRCGVIELIIDHNPFYLLSILCMLFGCYLFNNSLGIRAGNFSKLLFLLGTLNVYEFLLIGLALVLLRRMDVPRDGRTLTIMETLFLADVTFLNAETIMTDRAWGAVINGVLLVLALVKVLLLLNALQVRMGAARVGYLVVQFALLFAMPLAFTRPNAESDVPELRVYAMWWAVGLLPAVFDMLCRWQPRGMELAGGDGTDQTISHLYLLVPFISLVAHLRFNHWVWQVPMHWADYSPVLLGLAVILGRARPTKLVPQAEMKLYRVALPAAALLCALDGQPAMGFHLAGTASVVDPLKLSVAGSYLVYAYCFFLPYMHYLLVGGLVVVVADLFGPSARSIAEMALLCWTRLVNLLQRLMPATGRAWGLLSMVASFVFLALGAAVSLRKRRIALPEPQERFSEP